jgi:hypothetical protein
MLPLTPPRFVIQATFIRRHLCHREQFLVPTKRPPASHSEAALYEQKIVVTENLVAVVNVELAVIPC